MTLVKPVPLSTYLIEQAPPEIDLTFDLQVPMLQLPGDDQPSAGVSSAESNQLELGAAGMLSVSLVLLEIISCSLHRRQLTSYLDQCDHVDQYLVTWISTTHWISVVHST